MLKKTKKTKNKTSTALDEIRLCMHVPESTALQPKRKRPITFYNLQKLILFEIYFKLGGKN